MTDDQSPGPHSSDEPSVGGSGAQPEPRTVADSAPARDLAPDPSPDATTDPEADPSADPAADTGPEPDPDPAHDPWLRRVAVVMGVGLGVGILAAVGVGIAGASGQVGAVIILLVLSLAAGTSAVLALVTAAIEEFRGGNVSWRRPVLGIVLFVAAAMLMAMTVAAAG